MWSKAGTEFLAQLSALVAFFAFPAIQYLMLKRFARNEGTPELWYLPSYGFRLVIRNLPGKRTLSDIRQRAVLRTIIAANKGSSAATLHDDILSDRRDFFLFPGTDQILLSFQIQGDSEGSLSFVVTDKLGHELNRVPIVSFGKLICDYNATVNNPLNFRIKLAKRVEIEAASLKSFWRQIQKENVEQEFALDRVREVS